MRRAAAAGLTVNSVPAALRRILSIILFGIAFGYLEASVVVYLRTIGGAMRAAAGLSATDLFPLLRLDQLSPATLTLVRFELGREAATLLMLAALAGAVARDVRTWLAAFVLAFGVWDLTFYMWLRVLIGWPSSLLTWDILFLLPVPWAAPVLAPCIVAATMSIFGFSMLNSGPRRMPMLARVCLIGGSLTILAAFTWEWRRWMGGGMPERFPWLVFGLGEALMIAGLFSFSGNKSAAFGD